MIEEIHFPFDGVRKCLIDTSDSDTLTLTLLFVEPEFRRKKVGTRALRHLREIAEKRGYTWLRCVAEPVGIEAERVDITALRRFYKKNGFRLLSDNETFTLLL